MFSLSGAVEIFRRYLLIRTDILQKTVDGCPCTTSGWPNSELWRCLILLNFGSLMHGWSKYAKVLSLMVTPYNKAPERWGRGGGVTQDRERCFNHESTPSDYYLPTPRGSQSTKIWKRLEIFALQECHFRQCIGMLSENHPKGLSNVLDVSRHLPAALPLVPIILYDRQVASDS